jgi:hypothetical protein
MLNGPINLHLMHIPKPLSSPILAPRHGFATPTAIDRLAKCASFIHPAQPATLSICSGNWSDI